MRFSALGCVTLALLSGVATARGDAASPVQDERRIVRITAERFSFTPSEIKLQVGDVVELRLKSDDTIHGFRILDTDTSLAIPKRGGGEASLVFKAERPGRYTFECNRMCGAGHDFMRGVIIVRDPEGRAGH